MSVDPRRMAPQEVMRFMTWFMRFDTTARSASRSPVQEVALGLDPVGDPQDVVVDVLHVDDRLVPNALGLASQELSEHLAQRRDCTTEVNHAPTQVEHLLRD